MGDEEEVDWGVTADEDVLSLGGEEASQLEQPATAAAPAPVQAEKKPPTGPRRSVTSTSTSSSTIPPAQTQDAEAGTKEEKPLPEGWQSVMSRSQGIPFYSHAASGRTAWERPTEESEAKFKQEVDKSAKAAATAEDRAAPAAVAQETKKVEEAAAAAAGASTSRAAPLGPASWRSAQGQAQEPNNGRRFGTGNGTGSNRARDPEPDSPWEREAKRSRMISPANNGSEAANGASKNGQQADPSKRARSPPTGPANSSRGGSSYRPEPPRGPSSRSSSTVPVRQPTGPGANSNNGFDRARRDIDPPSRPARDRSPPRGPAPTRPENQGPTTPFRPPIGGANRAPLANNRWGSSSGTATPTLANNGGSASRQHSAGPAKLAEGVVKPVDVPQDERARLLEKKRKAQEELDKIKEEEDRLERLEADSKKAEAEEKKRDDDRKKQREEERRKEDELRKPAIYTERRRDDERLVDRERRPDLYDGRRRDDEWRSDRRREDDRWPPRDSRDSSGLPPRPRSPVGASSYRPPRANSPPPLAARLEPYGRRSPPRRLPSPPPQPSRGDSYRPDPRDSPPRPPRDFAQRLGPPPRERNGDRPFAEPMSRGPPPRERPLAERMGMDDRDRRYTPRDDRDRDRDRRW